VTNITSEKLPNRWGIVVAAVCVQLCLGAVFGWSVFKNPLMRTEHWSETSIQLNFTLAYICFALGNVVGGLWQDRVGPRVVGSTAGALYGLGYILAGLGASHHSLKVIYLGYGLFAGFGMGLGYTGPIATLVKWFPDKRGLMAGVAVCGFGFAAMLMSPFAAWEIINWGVPATFEILGIAYLIVLCVGAQFFVIPPAGWRPAGWEPRTAVAKAAGTRQFTVSEAMRTRQFYFQFLMLLMVCLAGYMCISQASPMAQELVGMTVLRAAAMVGLISIFNGLGRVFWAWVSDYVGRARAYFLIFLIEALMLFLLVRVHDWTLFSMAFALIGLCYGGGMGVMPSFVADYFGSTSVGGIYGMILFGANFLGAWSPIVIAHVHQTLGRYAPAINVITIVLACSLILPVVTRSPNRGQAATPAATSTD
jgi:OFA family oxalate/formate antiporter-like MFS transporter